MQLFVDVSVPKNFKRTDLNAAIAESCANVSIDDPCRRWLTISHTTTVGKYLAVPASLVHPFFKDNSEMGFVNSWEWSNVPDDPDKVELVKRKQYPIPLTLTTFPVPLGAPTRACGSTEHWVNPSEPRADEKSDEELKASLLSQWKDE